MVQKGSIKKGLTFVPIPLRRDGTAFQTKEQRRLGCLRYGGLTFIELLVVIGIIIIAIAVSVPAFRIFQWGSDVNNSAEEVINVLRQAQNKSTTSEQAGKWGVYFNISTTPHQYILFKGNNYAGREVSYDKVYTLPVSAKFSEFSLFNLPGTGPEVVFEKITGNTVNSGSITLGSKSDASKTAIIYVLSTGQLNLSPPPSPSPLDNARVKDSRHVHVDYSRIYEPIDTINEKITLTFTTSDGLTTTQKIIVIADNLNAGQIDWEGSVDVAGSAQKIKLHTHKLNSPDTQTQFCIHRDRRYNNTALTITISGDTSGSIIEYSADGLTTTNISQNASNPQWQ